MILKLKWSGCLLLINAILASPISMFTNAYAQGLENSLDWSIETSKKTFYPGEPVLLTLRVMNTMNQEAQINFGADGIEAFSMEIHDSKGLVAKGDRIRRGGQTRLGILTIPPGKTGQKSVVLNQWCSTALSPGQYHVICRVEPFGRSKTADRNALVKRYRLPVVVLELDIHVVKMDNSKLKKILEGLGIRASRRNPQNMEEVTDRELAREMLCFAESNLAVVYQVWLLRTSQYTWQKRDVINSLARSETLEAAQGLIETLEDRFVFTEDVKSVIIDAVYRLRETGKSDILNATNDFVAKYKRLVPAIPID